MKSWYKKIIAMLLVSSLLFGGTIPVLAKTIGNGTAVYVPNSNEISNGAGATYARILCLKNSGSSNGTLLCTYDQLKDVKVTMDDGTTVSKQVYPIYKSTDNGESWKLIANVYDKEYGLLKTSQPCLYELPQQVGDLKAGTLLLAGNIFDNNPYTQSRIVIYKSTDGGYTWSFLSEVDHGGACIYDPTPTSITTTVWEPFLGLSKDGKLVCYYSDERQKGDGVLQAVSLKTSSDGVNWSSLSNVAAITNKSDRPGMITVTALPNGKYMATYEVVNRPSQSRNNAIVYCKFSDDGVTWDANSLGTKITLADGRGIGSSPYVKWIDAGGPNGMVVISAKWGTDSNGNISGGQNFYINYNLGKGSWERLPMAVTYDYNDLVGGFFSGFSQSFDVSPDNTTLYQATNVENLSNIKVIDGTTYHLNDVRVGTLPLQGTIYEAEKATIINASIGNVVDGSNGQEVQYINEEDSSVNFQNIKVEKSGNYNILVRYSNGENLEASHSVTVNGTTIGTVNYPVTANWDRYLWSGFTCYLKAGVNSIAFTKNVGFAELDCIQVSDTESDFAIINQNSGKYLEIKSALTSSGAEAGQWGVTEHWCQKWVFETAGNGYYRIKNKNSNLYLDIENQSTEDGAKAIQSSYAQRDSQLWSLKEWGKGYCYIINKNSGKYLEVTGNSVEDGATIGQWGPTGYGCQKWTLIKEGIH